MRLGAGEVDGRWARGRRPPRTRRRRPRPSARPMQHLVDRASRRCRGRRRGEKVRQACASRSTSRTRLPCSAKRRTELGDRGRLGDPALLVGQGDRRGAAVTSGASRAPARGGGAVAREGAGRHAASVSGRAVRTPRSSAGHARHVTEPTRPPPDRAGARRVGSAGRPRGSSTSSGSGGDVKPTLAATSSPCTTISIIRPVRKSSRRNAHPVHGMSTARSGCWSASTSGSAARAATTAPRTASRPASACSSLPERIETLTSSSRPPQTHADRA